MYRTSAGCICIASRDPQGGMKQVSGGWLRSLKRARSPVRIVVAAARARCAMTRLHLALLALAALAAVAAAEPPRPRLIDFNPWAWIPTNRNRSPSIMDYFFPPSRTPKQSSLDPPADRQPPKTTTPIQTPIPTTTEERSTTVARKVSNKTKSTVPATNPTATAPPKTKKTSHKTTVPVTTTEMKTTQTATTIQNTKTSQHTKNTQTTKTELPTTRPTTLPTTYRSTKHYTIRPIVRTTEMPTVQDTETTANSDSTETFSDFDTSGTTAEGPKETVPTLSTVAESRSTDPGTASTASVESTTETDSTAEPADSREGYLPLRDKPQPQTHVKINEQTKKEVSDLTVFLFSKSVTVQQPADFYSYCLGSHRDCCHIFFSWRQDT